MSTRRSISKLARPIEEGIDAEFWPVVLAICLTGALAAGAVTSILDGTRMWSTLVALPFLVVAAIVFLQRVPEGRLRRGLQLGILCSVAAHLLFLIYAAWTVIFGSAVRDTVAQSVPRRPERVILVQRRDSNQIWKRFEPRPPVEKSVELEKQATEVETSRDFTEPASTTSQNVNLSMERREQSSSVPRLSETQSLVRRSEVNETSMSGGALQPSSTYTPANRSDARPMSAPSSLADHDQQRPQLQNRRAVEAESLPSSTTEPVAQAQRRSEEGTTSTEALAAMTTARLPARTASIREASRPATSVTAVPQPNATSKVPIATETPVESRVAESLPTRSTNAPEVPSQPAENGPRAQRRDSPPASESLVLSASEQPRRSRTESNATSSPANFESVAQPTPIKSLERAEPRMAETSLTRGSEGGAMASRSRDLSPSQSVASGMSSIPSTSARRDSPLNNHSLPESLTSQQATDVRRTVASESHTASAQQVNTSMTSQLTGQRDPAPESMESSAALQNSSIASNLPERTAADVGESTLDTGANKHLAESEATRNSSAGGGMKDVGLLQPDRTERADRTAAGQTPTLNAEDMAATAVAPRADGATSRPVSGSEAATEATESERLASADESRSGRATIAEPKSMNASEAVSGAPQMIRSDTVDDSDLLQAADADEDESARRGNTDARISRAAQNEAQVILAERQSNIGEGGDGESRESPRESEGVDSGRSLANAREKVAMEIPGTEGNASTNTGGARLNRSRTNEATQLAMHLRDDATGRANLPSESSMEVEAVRAESGETAARGDNRSRPESPQSQIRAERMAGSQRIERNTIEGPSGLGDAPSIDAGLPTRPAVRDSTSLQFESSERFQRESRVEVPSARTDAVAAKEAFKDRGPESSSGGPSTEPSIELGLQFLSRFQKGDGHWALEDFDLSHALHVHQMNSDAAATGLALLAFQGAGYNHREFKYAAAISRAVDWLIEHQDAEGCFYVSSNEKSDATCRLYSHAIATLALTEAYGMTQDSRLVEPCRRGLAYIARTQDPRRGGWRYYAEPQMRQSDTSVTGWMMMAMQSGRLAGFDTPDSTWRRISDWLDLARDSRDEGRFRYNPFAPDDRDYQSAVSPAMTGVGVLMRLYTGWTRDDARVITAADYMLKTPPSQDSSLVRDTYYWYYATQVLRHVGGERWDRWNLKLHPLLVESQTKTGELAGSWDPYGPVPDRWGHVGGRLYVTTMNLLSLEVDYRLLPLYDKTTR